MSALPARHLFTITDLEVMSKTGIFPEDARLELICGEIFEMSPIGPRHAACVRRLNNLLARQVGAEAVVDAQNPIILEDRSQPQPDLMLLQPRDDFYASGHPRPEDVLLLIEVGETSVAYDRDVKIPLYAMAGIPEVWLLDLAESVVTVYREPWEGGYRERVRYFEGGEQLRPGLVSGVSFLVGDLLVG